MPEKITQIIRQPGSLAILLEKNPEEFEFLAKEFLARAVSDKNIPVLCLPEDKAELFEKWQPILKEQNAIAFPQQTSIKIPKEKYGIKKISYQDEVDGLSLIITTDNEKISQEDILVKNLPPAIETVVCFFEKKEILDDYREKIQLPEQERIIFISTQDKTLSEKIFLLAEEMNENILKNSELTTILWASLLKETENFSGDISAETMNLATSLLKHGAEKNSVKNILDAEKKPPFAQLFGRMLARTFTDDSLSISWSFLNQKDLIKTGEGSPSVNFLYSMIKKLKQFISQQKLHILLWQSADGVMGLVAPGEKIKKGELALCAENLSAAIQSNFFIAGPFENFSKAELNIRQKIKELKSVEENATIR